MALHSPAVDSRLDASSRTTAPPPAQRRRRRSPQPRFAPYLFVLPVIVLFLAFKVYPYVYAFWLSMTTNEQGETVFVGAQNYLRLLADPLFYTALGNTFVILIIQVPIMLGLAIVLAVAFNSVLLKFRAIWRVSYFVPIVMGLVAYGILFSALLNTQFGLVNYVFELVGLPRISWLGDPVWAKVSIAIALTWHYTGQNAVIYLAQLQTIPGDLYEAAQMDGASAFQRFRHVTLPGLKPAITLTVILSTIGTLQLFDEPYVLTGGGPDNATLTIGMYLYQNGFKYFDFGYASAIGYALTLIISVLALIQFRALRERGDKRVRASKTGVKA